jgi:PAS domain S-box-containing protein
MERESARLRATGDPWNLRYRMLAEDGSIRWCNDRGLCVARDGNGRPWRFQGVVIDVTAETERLQRIESEHARLRSIVEGIPAITWTESIDASGRSRLVYISPQSRELFGWEASELVQEVDHFTRMVHPDDLPGVSERAAKADAAADLWEDSFRVIHRDGSTVWVNAMARRVTPEGTTPAIWQGVTFDVSARHRERSAIGGDLERAET